MAQYDEELSIREAREQYFSRLGLREGGYSNRWVKIQFGPFPVYFPNTSSRIEAVKRHDIHHIVTGYDANWIGEAEIGAWEISSGCGRFYAAWILNLYAFGAGIFFTPRALFRAFMKGRRALNLYHRDFSDDILSQTVLQLRRSLRIDPDNVPPRSLDYALFGVWSIASLASWLVSIGVPLILILFLIKSISGSLP